MKHTLGPWKTVKDVNGKYLTIEHREGNGGEVCRLYFYSYNPRPAQQHANARLIEAAPDLLDALRRLHRYVHDTWGFGDDRPSLLEIDEECCILFKRVNDESDS